MITLAFVGLLVVACESNTYEEVSVVVATPTYTKDIQPIMSANCISCHSTDGGQEPYLENYDQVKNAIINNGLLDEIAAPTGEGMPEAQRMPQSKIDAVTSWANNGFPNQ
ncbi:hypothetical protein FNO01nite_17130 [Flavobacterium noncentrifugens]|uniref:Cytochrome c domain-containing protein n=1 Tax=Flavobacterium noncentrifugens TaxID=1128970 RepID=A0A1G8WSF9_9FLAO|nr:cytochrome c [Flavobacterium noncentrifugens]GEP51041.1 hypothetical protein FNO01nite_17130 [Flavobacterium noncentrifugens]SDJ81298.1 hypothetical protein SAMN04487935_1939 [Flavobacterium noncentrifugens]